VNFKAIIFDMDGVIVDSEPIHERAFLELFSELGYAENHGIDFVAYYGRSDRALLVDFFAQHQVPYSLDELIARKQRHFLEILERERPIFPAIPALVAKLSRQYPLAIASGSNHTVINAVVEMGALRPFFSVLVSVHDVAKPKPAPDVFLRAAELLKAAPAECCVIEDAAVGVEAAVAAGMKVIAITNSLPAEALSRAAWVVKNYAEIGPILDVGRGAQGVG
jgi:HAD superfamily hydrolase (TIGR01509 family)